MILITETKLKRMSDETVDEYIYRVCRNKDIGMYDITWQDVGNILNSELELEYTESKYRKEYQAMQRGIDMMINKKADLEDQAEEIKLLKMELEMERKKKQTEAVYYNRVLRENARQEMLYERVERAISNAELIVPEFKPLQIQKQDEEWLLGFSDVHAYKYFESITNKYNKEILEHRMNKLLGEIIYEIEKNSIKELIILNGGDNLEGIIRNSQLQSLELGLIDTVIEFQRWLLEWLNQLSQFVNIKYIPLTSANHSQIRPLGSRAGQFPKEDLEKVIANYIYDMCKDNPRIEVVVPEYDFVLFEIAGYNVIAHHGHGIKNPEKYIDKMSRKLRV
ncbi:MAG TPA: hypothetical protein VK982_01855, partial [Bacteroidales bacterium]|nr:hypothetical protein [Bacteroidales bacterium]